jgi:CP family cyanate transporter-like MFS transporter
MRALPSDGTRGAALTLMLLALLWLSGAALRIPLLGVPPVLPMIRQSLHMSEAEVGLLMSLPLAVLAVAAIPGSLIVSRLGATRTMIAGLAITAVAGAARSAAPEVLTLYAATMAMGFGIAIGQPALPVIVREWLPARRGVATAAFTNGSLLGAVGTSWLTIPVVLPMVGQNWRLAIAVWAVPVVVAAVIFAIAAPPTDSDRQRTTTPPRWWPDWKSPLTWALGLTFGVNNAIYFGINAFLPDYLHATGQEHLVTAALTALNMAQLVVSFIMLVAAEHLQRRASIYLVFGPGALLGLIGIVTTSGSWTVAMVALAGLSTAINYIVMLALPAVLAAPQDTHRTAAGMFTIGFTLPVVIPVISGALWDVTHLPWTAFVPFMLCAIAMTLIGPALTRFPVPDPHATVPPQTTAGSPQ